MKFVEFFQQSANRLGVYRQVPCSLILALTVGLGLESAARGDGRGDMLLASLGNESLSDLPALPFPESVSVSTQGHASGGSIRLGGAKALDGVRYGSRLQSYSSTGTGLALTSVLNVVDGNLWRESGRPRELTTLTRLDGVSFPHVATRKRPMTTLRRSYQRMVLWSDDVDASGRRNPIANVQCMGLLPDAIARRAMRYERQLVELALEHKVSVNLIKAIIATESCFNPDAVSRAGAVGLMQLMPETARWLKAGDPRDVDNNLRAGVRYFAQLHRRFGTTVLALAAYNAGPGNVRRFGGVPPFTETREYIEKVMAKQRRYRAASKVVSR